MMKLGIAAVVLDSGNSEELSDFYVKFLGWEKFYHDEWFVLFDSEKKDYPCLLIQETESYERPVWPDESGKQHTMMHLDFHVENVEEVVKHALSCGAVFSEIQMTDAWRVMLDPAGHPFCICPIPTPPLA